MRQSMETQVLNDVGSTESQRNQRRYAEAWGWAADRIEVIDDDLGLSGASRATALASSAYSSKSRQGSLEPCSFRTNLISVATWSRS